MMFGKNIESACKAWTSREMTRLNRAADHAAEQGNRFPVGSPEWMQWSREFVKIMGDLESLKDSF